MSASNIQGVAAYWTPARMRAAYWTGRAGAGLSATAASAGPGAPGPAARSGSTAQAASVPWWRQSAAAWRSRSNAPGLRAIGVLFSTLPDGEPWSCTATVVRSMNRSTIWTAGHCVYLGGWNTKVMFVPDYQPQSRQNPVPFGQWPATAEMTTDAWQTDGGVGHFREDLGAVVVGANQAGQTISAALGAAQRISFATPPTSGVVTFGYPNGGTFHGLRWACGPHAIGPDSAVATGAGPTPLGMSCNMPPGASGGPWLAHMNGAGVGTIVSVTSSAFTNRPVIFGPAPGPAAEQLYEAAERRAP